MIDTKLLRQEQAIKAKQIILTDNFVIPNLIAGADVGFEEKGSVTRAAMVVMRWPSLAIVEYHIARIPTEFPYIPGLLSFREYPALLAVWEKLQHKPDLIMVDGQGIAHPRRFGVASHLGLLLDIPTIGIAKKRLCGHHEALDEIVESCQPLNDNNEQIGWVFRSKKRCKPLYISPGHKISLDASLLWVERCIKGYRLPEPTRWADGIASNRAFFNRIKQNLA